jgi:hypothetical protein
VNQHRGAASSIHGRPGFSLPIATVSAVAYQTMVGARTGHTSAAFTSVADTEIGDLQVRLYTHAHM